MQQPRREASKTTEPETLDPLVQKEVEGAESNIKRLDSLIDKLENAGDDPEIKGLRDTMINQKLILNAAMNDARASGNTASLGHLNLLVRIFLSGNEQKILSAAKGIDDRDTIAKTEAAATKTAKLMAVEHTRGFMARNIEGFDQYNTQAQNYFAEITQAMVANDPFYREAMELNTIIESDPELKKTRDNKKKEAKEAYKELMHSSKVSEETKRKFRNIKEKYGAGNFLDFIELNNAIKDNDTGKQEELEEKILNKAKKIGEKARKAFHEQDPEAAEAAEEVEKEAERTGQSEKDVVLHKINKDQKKHLTKDDLPEVINDIANKPRNEWSKTDQAVMSTTGLSAASTTGAGVTFGRDLVERGDIPHDKIRAAFTEYHQQNSDKNNFLPSEKLEKLGQLFDKMKKEEIKAALERASSISGASECDEIRSPNCPLDKIGSVLRKH